MTPYRSSHRLLYAGQTHRKWTSSSVQLHNLQSLLSGGIECGLWYLPNSIWSLWQLALILVRAIRYFATFTSERYITLQLELGLEQFVNSNTWMSFSKWICPNSCSSSYGCHFKQVSFTTKQDRMSFYTTAAVSSYSKVWMLIGVAFVALKCSMVATLHFMTFHKAEKSINAVPCMIVMCF